MAGAGASAHALALGAAGLCAALTVLVSARLISQHVRHWTKPVIQRKIVGILYLAPVYAAASFLSLAFKGLAVYLDLFRDCYEAYSIWLFLALCVALLNDGDEFRVLELMEGRPPVRHPWPFDRVWAPEPLGPPFLRRAKLATMQFVVAKPLLAIFAAAMEALDGYDQGNFRVDRAYAYVALAQNVSVTWAFYWLLLFYAAFKGDLAPHNPLPKFVAIKAVLFLSFWQGLVIAVLAKMHVISAAGTWSVEQVANGAQNFLLCVEMLAAALAHHYAFSYKPFIAGAEGEVDDDEPTGTGPGAGIRLGLLARPRLRDQLAVDDAVNDLNDVLPGRMLVPSRFRPGAARVVERVGPGGGTAYSAERTAAQPSSMPRQQTDPDGLGVLRRGRILSGADLAQYLDQNSEAPELRDGGLGLV